MANVDTSLHPVATGAAAQLAAQHASDHPLKLYSGWFCPFVQRAWITLEEKKIAYQYVEINPYRKDAFFLALNPRGLVPTLAVGESHNGESQKPQSQKTLSESTVICEYLDEAYADESLHGPRLLPSEPYARARARLWIDHVATRIVPAFYRFLQHTPDRAYGVEEARAQLLGHISTWVRAMDAGGPWFLGGEMSLVDISLAPWAMRLFLLDHYKAGGVGIPDGGPEDGVWRRWGEWVRAVEGRRSVRETWSDGEMYVMAYRRYADDTTGSEVGRATREGRRLP